MKYMLLIETNPDVWEGLAEQEQHEVFAGRGAFAETAASGGEMVGSEMLTDPSHSAVVRVRDGMRLVTEGPSAETGELFAGYYIVDVETRDRALELAAMIPDARFGAIEVRPIMSRGGTEM